MHGALYDVVLAATERCSLRGFRRELIAEASGRVLEVGVGTGANLAHYPDGVDLTLLDPSPEMAARVQGHTVVTGFAEELPFDGESFDTVVCTLVLCSVRDLDQAVREAARVLRPGGRYLFLEHVVSQRPFVERVQHSVDPVWQALAGNCHLARDSLGAIGRHLRVLRHERARMWPAPFFVAETVRGVAVKG